MEERRENAVQQKSMKFAVRIVRLSQYLQEEKKEFTLSKQILRCGTSIGANLAEAAAAFSRKDFLSKSYIAFKECSETLYWLELLKETEYIDFNLYKSMHQDCEELKKLLSSITKTTKDSMNS
ncbi:MAG: four helix bundle protein [Oscillospiraceae bacterium]|nr:four helix bundle protein [Oscillospiraceae bacterium]